MTPESALDLSRGWSWDPADRATVRYLEEAVEGLLGELSEVRRAMNSDLRGSPKDWIRLAQKHEKTLNRIADLCDDAEATCYRSGGDPADERCHREGCAQYLVDREDIRAILRGDA